MEATEVSRMERLVLLLDEGPRGSTASAPLAVLCALGVGVGTYHALDTFVVPHNEEGNALQHEYDAARQEAEELEDAASTLRFYDHRATAELTQGFADEANQTAEAIEPQIPSHLAQDVGEGLAAASAFVTGALVGVGIYTLIAKKAKTIKAKITPPTPEDGQEYGVLSS